MGEGGEAGWGRVVREGCEVVRKVGEGGEGGEGGGRGW